MKKEKKGATMAEGDKRDGQTEVLGPEHPISRTAGAISSTAIKTAATLGLSRWELAIALANACGQNLADSPTLTRAQALTRMDKLREAMGCAYDLWDVQGSG